MAVVIASPFVLETKVVVPVWTDDGAVLAVELKLLGFGPTVRESLVVAEVKSWTAVPFCGMLARRASPASVEFRTAGRGVVGAAEPLEERGSA